jgi:uncharacterized protein (DUF2236 family)
VSAAAWADLDLGPDPGIFGPGSVTWRVHSDPSMALGGFRALLLQAVHPRTMAGFAANSSWQDDPWGRLRRTAEYLATVAFGTTAEAEAAGAHLRAIHRRLSPGVDPDTGSRFRLDSPDLLLWVHVTEVESFLSTYRRCGGPLSDAEADRYVDEMRRSAQLVGLYPDEVPGSVAEIEEYYRGVRPQLRVTPTAWRNVGQIFAPPMPSRVVVLTPARPAWASLIGLSAALLPRWARRLYHLPGWPTTDLTATLAGRALRTATLTMPARVRQSPHHRAALQRVGIPQGT